MTVAVLLPNLTNARELSLNFEDGRVLNRQTFINELSARDHLRFYIDGKQAKDSPRITFVKTRDQIEVSVSFPSFQRDKKNREASFAVLFQINDQVTEALKKMAPNFGEFQDDFSNAISFFSANLKSLRQSVTESAKEFDHGELPDFETPLESSVKKKSPYREHIRRLVDHHRDDIDELREHLKETIVKRISSNRKKVKVNDDG